jgi:spectinomycin phosphotransferase
MLEKPNLPDEVIIACLRTSYKLPATGVEFLPIGNDSNAWVYRVRAENGESYFLKARKGAVNQASLVIPRYLKDRGIEQVIAPIPTDTGQLWQPLRDFALILYPFTEGRPVMGIGMSDAHWVEFGCVLKKIHATPLSPELSGLMRKETLSPKWRDYVREITAQLSQGQEFENPYAKEFALLWQENAGRISALVEQTDALARQVQAQKREFVLCHADIHMANILLDQDDKIFIVDWDEVVFAPKERDLMYMTITAGPVAIGAKAQELFFQGYGDTEIDERMLAYYRHEWVVQDIGEFAKDVLGRDDSSDETKQDSLQWLRRMLQPSGVVDAVDIGHSI